MTAQYCMATHNEELFDCPARRSVAKWRRQIEACPVKDKLTQHQPPLDDAFGCHHSKVRAMETRAAVARRWHVR